MKNLQAVVKVLVLATICCQLASAAILIFKVNKFIKEKIVPQYGYDAVQGARVLREYYQNKYTKNYERSDALKEKVEVVLPTLPTKARVLFRQLLNAADMFEKQQCDANAYKHFFDDTFLEEGAGHRLLLSFLEKRDEVCAEKITEMEKEEYASLDEAKRNIVDQLAGIARESLKEARSERSFPMELLDDSQPADAQGESGVNFFVATDKNLIPTLLSNNRFFSSLIDFLEKQTGQHRCKFVNREKEVLEEQIINACDALPKTMTNNYPEDFWWYVSKPDVRYKQEDKYISGADKFRILTFRRPVAKSLVHEHNDYFHHMIGFKVCAHISDHLDQYLSNFNKKLSQECH